MRQVILNIVIPLAICTSFLALTADRIEGSVFFLLVAVAGIWFVALRPK